jgi:hypothetical protein
MTEADTKAKVLHLTEYAIKLFGTEPGEPHRQHFMVAAVADGDTLVSAACCPAGLAQTVLQIILTRPDQVETEEIEARPAGEKGN